MSLFDKVLNLFIKKPEITVVKDDSDLYKSIKDSMDNFEKNATIENVRSLVSVMKLLVTEIQILKEAAANQNEVLMNLVMVNQRIVAMLNNAMVIDEDDEGLDNEDIELNENDDDDVDDITETAVEKSKRVAAKKFGAN